MAVELGTEDARQHRSDRPARLLVIAGVVLVVAAAIVVVLRQSDDAEVATKDPTLSSVASATLEEGSARVEVAAEDGTFRMEGLMSFGPDGRGRFEYTDSRIQNPAGELIALPDASYVEFEGHWVRFTNEEFSEGNGYRLGTDRNEFLAVVQLFIESLDHADPDSVRTTGTDVVRGDDVTVIEATIDLREAIRSSSVEFDAAAAAGHLPPFGSDLVVMLDEQGRARRVVLSGGDEDLTIELWDFGVAVEVEAPADRADPESMILDQIEQYDELNDAAGVDVHAVYCPLSEELPPMLTATEPSSNPEDWASAAETMTTLAAEAPVETKTWTGMLASAYDGVGVALASGASLVEITSDGVDTEYGLLDWRTIRDAERGFAEASELLCR